MIINMSVWESVEALWSFVYDGGHLEVMRRRREWMTKLAETHMAAHGPSEHAFPFKQLVAR